MVCVITRHSAACGNGFHRCALGFHADVAIPLQHLATDVSGNRHDDGVCRASSRKGRDSAVPEIVEPETGHPCLVRHGVPGTFCTSEIREPGMRVAFDNTREEDYAEQIVSLLRQVEVAVASGKTTAQACKEGAITEQTYYR